MDLPATIAALNRALALEYAGVIQYLQAAALVQGPERQLHADFFRQQSESAWKHAEAVGRWIVLLDGLPTVEPAPIRQSTDLTELLRQGLDLERETHRAYLDALGLVAEDPALRVFVEAMVQAERLGIDEFERMLRLKRVTVPVREVTLKRA